MATDISTAKTTIPSDSLMPSAKAPPSGNASGIDFAEIIRNNGSHLDKSLNALANRAGITGVGERPEDIPAANDYYNDAGRERYDESANRPEGDERSGRPADRQISSQSDQSNEYRKDHPQDNRPETTDGAYDAQDNLRHAENRGENTNSNERANDSSNNDNTSTQETESSGPVKATNDQDTQQASAEGESKNTNENNGKATQSVSKATTAEQMLASLLANAQGTALPGQASGQAQQATTDGQAKTNVENGLNMAIANVGKKTEGEAAGSGQNGNNSGNAQAQTQTHNLNKGQVQAQTQAQTSDNAGTQLAGDTQAKEISKTADQAAQISKMVGNGNKIDVSVSVTDEKSSLVSKPSAALVASPTLAADTTAPSLRNHQSQGASNANGQAQAQLTGEQVTNATGQAQQAIQQVANNQGQSTNSGAIDAKGTVQGNLHAGSLQATQSGNGETPVTTAPGSTTAAQQAQQNTSTQAANANRFTTANPALADQVSVQISKAVNAGNDKISIQLRPADMGRVDVKMDIGQDGRLIAVVSADNKGTLDLLQKDARELQQALQQAGLQLDNDSLSFNLREQGEGQEMANNRAGGGEQGMDAGLGDELSLEQELAGVKRNIITDSRIDVRA